jgi:hypothetical protein
MHPRTRDLAQQWRQENSDPLGLAQRALNYFKEKGFIYTLSPPLLPDDPVDEFLFDTRQGFCEHYAAAFTILMRAAGVPARVVTGYQGGEINPLGNYLIVRQRDAHAWSEIWIEGQGWLRVDPTAAVSAARVEQGIGSALPQPFQALGFRVSEHSLLAEAWRQLGNGWDALNNGWNDWVLGYGPTYQKQLLEWLGLERPSYRELAALLAATLGLPLAALGAWLLRGGLGKAASDPAQRLYLRFCARLARRGLTRRPSEGPLCFAARASAHYPALAEQIEEIVRLYIEMRYHAQPLEKRLSRAVRRFRP